MGGGKRTPAPLIMCPGLNGRPITASGTFVDIQANRIPGCYEISPKVIGDKRGRFVKIFHRDLFAEHGLSLDLAEEYYSESVRGVLRGLHFQTPPMDHVKLVYCIVGEAFDAVVDLRAGSPTYGQFATFHLTAQRGNAVYAPPGLAHGFCVTSEQAVLVYKVSSVHAPLHDAGILWNSAGIPWPAEQPIISERDLTFPTLKQYQTPFVYHPPL